MSKVFGVENGPVLFAPSEPHKDIWILAAENNKRKLVRKKRFVRKLDNFTGC